MAVSGSSPKCTASMPTARAASTLSRLSSTKTLAGGGGFGGAAVDRVAAGRVPLRADVRGLAENEFEDRSRRVAHVGLETADAAEERARDDAAVVPDDGFDRRCHEVHATGAWRSV